MSIEGEEGQKSSKSCRRSLCMAPFKKNFSKILSENFSFAYFWFNSPISIQRQVAYIILKGIHKLRWHARAKCSGLFKLMLYVKLSVKVGWWGEISSNSCNHNLWMSLSRKKSFPYCIAKRALQASKNIIKVFSWFAWVW